MSEFCDVNLLVTGQIRDRIAFERLLANVNSHRMVFKKLAFSTWTQEIQSNADQITLAEDILDVLDAGNLLPISPVLNRDIIGVFAQSRQLFRGIDHFNDRHPILRIRADDLLCGSLNLTDVISSVNAYWRSTGKITTVVKASTAEVPCFLDDRLYIISPQHIALLKSFSFSALLGLHHRNFFPEFALFAPLFQKESKDLDCLIGTDVRSLRYQLNDMRDIGRWLSRTQLVVALECYRDVLSSRISFFEDAIAPDVQERSNFTQYILEAKGNVGPTTMAEATSAITNLIERIKNGQSKPVDGRSRESYEQIENLKSLVALKFSKEDHKGAINTFESSVIRNERDPDLLERIGISYFKTGDMNRSYEILRSLHSDGGRTFYHLFYLSAALVELKDQAALYLILNDLLKFHGENRTVADHVLNCAMHFEDTARKDYFSDMISGRWYHDKPLLAKAKTLNPVENF